MAAHTDCFGRTYARLADFSPPRMIERVVLTQTDTARYLGALTRWDLPGPGGCWSHSLHRFGEPALPDLGTALSAFCERAGFTGSVSARRARRTSGPAREG